MAIQTTSRNGQAGKNGKHVVQQSEPPTTAEGRDKALDLALGGAYPRLAEAQQMSDAELLAIPNMGPKGLAEIRAKQEEMDR